MASAISPRYFALSGSRSCIAPHSSVSRVSYHLAAEIQATGGRLRKLHASAARRKGSGRGAGAIRVDQEIEAAEPALPTRDQVDTVAFDRICRIVANGGRSPYALIVGRLHEGYAVVGSAGLGELDHLSQEDLASFVEPFDVNVVHSVADASREEPYRTLAGLLQDPRIGMMAGAPLIDGNDQTCGMIWVADTRVRQTRHEIITILNDSAVFSVQRLHPQAQVLRARRAETMLYEAIDALADGFVYYDSQDRLLVCNRRYREIYARSAHAILPGACFPDILRAGLANGQYPEAEGQEDAWLARRLARHRLPRSTIEQHLPDGQWVRIEEKVTQTGGRVGLRINITELKRQEAELRAAHEELARQNAELERQVAARTATIATQSRALAEALEDERENNQALRRFVTMVSHEFRTPLAIMDASAGRIERKAKRNGADWTGEYTTMIRSSIKRLIRLIESVLGAAKADAGTIRLKPVELDLAEVVETVRAEHSDVSPDYGFEIDCSALTPVRADPTLVYQIVANLIGNAIKYSEPEKPIEVTGKTVGPIVELRVRDHGIGIPEDELPKMFERFFRASTAAGIAGSGLGVNLSRDIARMHGGDITVESEVDAGTTFILTLPVAGPDIPDAPEDEGDGQQMPKPRGR